jgi:transcriptional regulator with GAF, ATPase, and Fis domain
VFPIRIPPLRERPEDIPLLVLYFAPQVRPSHAEADRIHSCRSPEEALPAGWPGNMRELENFLGRSVILTRGSTLQAQVAELGNNGRNIPQAGTRETNERDEILRVLKITNGRGAGPDGAAAGMDMKRTTLISRMKKLGIEPRKALCPSIKRSFLPPRGSFCFLELWTLELPPLTNRRQVSRSSSGFSRHHPAPDLSRPLKSAI